VRITQKTGFEAVLFLVSCFVLFLSVSPLGAFAPPSEEQTSHYPLIEIEIAFRIFDIDAQLVLENLPSWAGAQVPIMKQR